MSRRVDTVTVVGGLQFSQGGQRLAAYCVRSPSPLSELTVGRTVMP